MASKELLSSDLHLPRSCRVFRSLVKVNKHSISIARLLSLPITTTKLLSRKGVAKFLICAFVAPYLLFSAYCPAWLALQSDTNTEKSINKVPLCPCRVSTTWCEQQLGFNADPACDARKSGYLNCRFHQGAKGCYRRKSTTSDAGAQCCYDNNGEWITEWEKGAGTLDFYYPETLRDFPTYQHFFSDVLSYFSCYIGATAIFNSKEQYMRYRPPGKCTNMLPTPVCRNRDLNVSTWKEKSYKSDGYGEYSSLKS